MAVLWGASINGVSNKLPTRNGVLNTAQVTDNLETATGLVLARVGSEGAVPPALWQLAARVVEFGAAALTEQQDFPEQSVQKGSLGQALWGLFETAIAQVVSGVEALGGEPSVAERPAYNFGPQKMLEWIRF